MGYIHQICSTPSCTNRRAHGIRTKKLRSEVNQWIRTTTEIDGCVDFDRAVCNPAHPTAFADGFDSGDHLHPSAAAYARMAQEVPAVLIQKER